MAVPSSGIVLPYGSLVLQAYDIGALGVSTNMNNIKGGIVVQAYSGCVSYIAGIIVVYDTDKQITFIDDNEVYFLINEHSVKWSYALVS